jgi:hypothetical protein
MQQAVAHQDETGVIGNLALLMKVECERIRALDSIQKRCEIGRQNSQCPAGSTHMEPQALAA